MAKRDFDSLRDGPTFIVRIRDRRIKPTSFLSKYTFRGRRKAHRRQSDKQSGYYVDRIGWQAGILILLIFVLSIIDAVFTIICLGRGFYEANPLMRFSLTMGNVPFVIIKLAVTISGAIILGLHKNFKGVFFLLFAMAVFYTTLNINHVRLLYF
jgi:hypothetical protein